MSDVAPLSLFSPFQQVFENFWNVPVTSWSRLFNPQVVFNYNPDDEDVEKHVLGRVGSYGSQLSTLIDAIDVLQRRLDRGALTEAEGVRLREFDRLRDAADAAVDEFRGVSDADGLIHRLEALRVRDPAAFASVTEALSKMGPEIRR
jgi:hypothetical protein